MPPDETTADPYAVIAALRAERDAALAREAALAGVLDVINRSSVDPTLVFETILENAHHLCGAAAGSVQTWDGSRVRALATHGFPEPIDGLLRQPFPPSPAHQSLIDGDRVFHSPDVRSVAGQTDDHRTFADDARARTILIVPLRKDQSLLGFISAYRFEAAPFSHDEIALLQSFAAQAVIAMENARLLDEQREALEQQTAMAEVLQVINASPGELTPVFDALLEKAMRLCGASFGELHTFDRDRYVPGVTKGVPAAYADYRRQNSREGEIRPGTIFRRVQEGARVVHIPDLMAEEAYRDGDPGRHAMVDLGGARTFLGVALRKDDSALGLMAIYRQEVRPFSEKQVALLQNFAAQAVIAMENARLLTEQREALEQQTATAEVLQVINSSPGNLAPVFEAVLDKATKLCDAAFGILWTYDGERFYPVALHRTPPAFADFLQGHQATGITERPGTAGLGALLDGEPFQQVLDAADGELYHSRRSPLNIAFVELGGGRSGLIVPLRYEGKLLGGIRLFRQEVRPFSDKQTRLLQNFADHAVIAIENARLLDEIRQRQAELGITFENMGDGVALYDEKQRLVAWNSKFQAIFGFPDAVLEQRGTFAEHVRYLAERGDYGPGVEPDEQIRRLAADPFEAHTYERTRPDGRVIEIRRNPVPSGGFVLIFSDITERKRNEAVIRAARDAAEEASRTIEAAYRDLKAAQANLIQAEKMASLGQLTAGIAHEIKNPLNFVNNFAGLSVELLNELKETAAPGFAMLDEARRAEIEDLTRTLSGNLEKINEHGNRADAIVRSMLEHSRGSSGERRSVNLNTLVDEALNLAYHGARAQDQGFSITLQRELDANIAPIILVPQDVTRVLLNLFSNGFYAARRRQSTAATPGFEPALSVTTRELGDGVEIRVRDNGIGIPEEVKDKLFQPFFTTKPTGQGTGLGLSISYDIITQQHGGSITVDSKVSEYSEFTIRLPCQS